MLGMDYAPDAVYGSYDQPYKFEVSPILEQTTQLAKGWSWKSIYIEPLSENIDFILPSNKNDLKKFQNITTAVAITFTNM